MMLPLQYDPGVRHPIGTKHTTDLEDILDSIARNSFLLNMPEEHPDRWGHHRKRLGKKELDLLNKYRVKFDLPELSSS